MKNFVFVVLVLTTSNAFAGLTKWTDEQGRIHYSDGAPPVRAQAVTTLPNASPLAPAVSPSPAPVVSKAAQPDATATRKAAADKAAQEVALKEQNRVNCAGAKQNLANLADGMRISSIDPNTGERSFMSDEQRQQNIAQAQQQISQYCQ